MNITPSVPKLNAFQDDRTDAPTKTLKHGH